MHQKGSEFQIQVDRNVTGQLRLQSLQLTLVAKREHDQTRPKALHCTITTTNAYEVVDTRAGLDVETRRSQSVQAAM